MESKPGAAPADTRLAWVEPAGEPPLAVEAPCSLGRCGSNQIVLAGAKVSRRHALIHARNTVEFWLADLSSTNGTYLNGHRLIRTARLYDKDLIAIGPHRLTFRLPGGPKRLVAGEGATEASLGNAAAECGWLLSVQFVLPAPLQPEEVPTILGRWQEDCTEVIERHSGKLTQYLTDGFLAFWHDRRANRPAIAHAVAELSRHPVRSQPRFFLILHHGRVCVTHANSENLSGPAVSFVLRARNLDSSLKSPTLISEAARGLLRPYLTLHDPGAPSRS